MSEPIETARDLLKSLTQGDLAATEQLTDLLYEELRRLASRFMAGERAGHTLQTTALAHEAYLRLVGTGDDGPDWEGRGHFLATAATVMRRILVDHARERGAAKRGGGLRRVTIDDAMAAGSPALDVLDLHEALESLAEIHERPARSLELRYFGGLTAVESARVLGVSTRTVETDLAMGRAWLAQALGGGSGERST